MGTRDRKQLLLTSVRFRCQVARLPDTQTASWENMLRKARSPVEQDQVVKALDAFLKGGSDQWSILRQGGLSLGEDEDETRTG